MGEVGALAERFERLKHCGESSGEDVEAPKRPMRDGSYGVTAYDEILTLLAAGYAPPGRDAALPPHLDVLRESQLPVTLSHAQAERQWVWYGRYWRLLTTREACGCGADTCTREQAGG